MGQNFDDDHDFQKNQGGVQNYETHCNIIPLFFFNHFLNTSGEILEFFLLAFSHQHFILNLPDLYILIQQRTYFLSYQNIIQFGCLTLPLLWLVTILFYAAGLSLPRVFMAFSLLFPEKQTEKKTFFALLFYQENEQVSCQGSQLLL